MELFIAQISYPRAAVAGGAEKAKGKTTSGRPASTRRKKAARVAELEAWKAANPDKMAEAGKRRQAALKQERKVRPFVGIDLEGFDTWRYFTDDRRDYEREHQENRARGDLTFEQCEEYLRVMHVPEDEKPDFTFKGWTVHDRKWYLAQHDSTEDDPHPRPDNRKPGAPEIYIEHRPFLLGAGNDEDQFFIPENDAPGVGHNSKKYRYPGGAY
jgi:hypothetical protein